MADQALRDQLVDSHGFWLPQERFKFLRLIGLQPVQANQGDSNTHELA